MRLAILLSIQALALGVLAREGHEHGTHGAHEAEKPAEKPTGKPIAPPRVFLDKSPRIVRYQLKRLSNERLLLVERNTSHARYAPVWFAILTRAGMSAEHREKAVDALVTIRKSSRTRELVAALDAIDGDDPQERRTGREIASLLLRQGQAVLAKDIDALRAATDSENAFARPVGHAALIVAGVSRTTGSDEPSTLDWLAAVALVPDGKLRAELREPVAALVDASHSIDVRRAAVRALASVPSGQDETFRLVAPLVAPLVDRDELRATAIRTLLRIPDDERDARTSRALIDRLVAIAEATPAAKRTTGDFVDAMQLADGLLASIPLDAARPYRARLREIAVRVVRIKTVEEEMRYDTAYFAVEAGRPVQVILENHDLMPHNFVVTSPGALEEVAKLGLAIGPEGHDGKQYVPDDDRVLHATKMVQPAQQERLTFTAPSEVGEYPYVCTFPNHWMRMYGVMVVVDDLDAWLRDPVAPKDPIGSMRPFVRAWALDDFPEDLDPALRGRSAEIGAHIFSQATCALCHTVAGEGGAVGPELTDVFDRWKGDRRGILWEILDPSHRVDPKYAVRVIVTRRRGVVTGVVTAEDGKTVSIFENPESKKTTVIPRTDIVSMVKTSTSLMPKALLDRFTRDEIYELLAFLTRK